jgi:hypothetical protein
MIPLIGHQGKPLRLGLASMRHTRRAVRPWIASRQEPALRQPQPTKTHWRRYRAAARAYASFTSTSTGKTAARFSMDGRFFVRSW